MEDLIEEFSKDYREYVTACINYSEIQEEYVPLSFEEELEWVCNWWRNHATKIRKI